ncbi:hypothetical protein LJC56_00810 [Christensenellaceae bacterium OttesenSCG-928-K19]|nr:hypothetical protein [Christensenellaceae bacterium OttesenSCG-928-K19]
MPSRSIRRAKQPVAADEYIANFNVFLGNEGLCNALLTLLDYISSCPGEKEVIAVMGRAYQRILESPEFLEAFKNKLHMAYRNGVRIVVIGDDGFESGGIDCGYWLWANLNGYARSVTCASRQKLEGMDACMVVKDCVALRVINDPGAKDGLYTAMFTDEATVRQVFDACGRYAKMVEPCYSCGFMDTPSGLLLDFHKEELLRSPVYLYTRTPSFGTIAQDKAHLCTQTTQSEARKRTEQLPVLFYTPVQYDDYAAIRHIYCIEDIEGLLLPGRHENKAFSMAFGKKTNYSGKRLKSQLMDIYRWLGIKNNYEVAFVPARVAEQIPVELLSVEGSFTVAWLQDGSGSTCIKGGSQGAVHEYARNLWEGIPQVYKNKHNNMKLLRTWIDTINV